MSLINSHYHWHIKEAVTTTTKLATDLQISPSIAQLLVQRQIQTTEEADRFLHPNLEDLHDPFAFRQMATAVNRIVNAIEEQESIVIYGDYDVDGISATALLYRCLQMLGANVSYYIPNRMDEGYGLNEQAIIHLAKKHSLLISVDCGITASQEISTAKSLGLDVIITDHHLPQSTIPVAQAILNPHVPAETYPFKDLCGAGIALKLAHGLALNYYNRDKALKVLESFTDIAALGTIADIVPLRGENRIITYWGLKNINKQQRRIGIDALCKVSKLQNKTISTGQVGFALAPRLNASGRIGLADNGVELLLTEDISKAQELAQHLDQENTKRRSIENRITQEAIAMLEKQDLSKMRTIVLKGEGWHHGVVGIVASRLVEKYYRPTILLCEENGELKGSARSIKAVHMLNMLKTQHHLLSGYGGHAMAAGLSLSAEHFSALQTGFEQAVRANTTAASFQPELDIDLIMPFADLNQQFVEELSLLEPFGFGNPRPVFMSKAVEIKQVKALSNNKHLKLTLQQADKFHPYLAWRQGALAANLLPGQRLDIVYTTELNQWQGRTEISLVHRDFRQSSSSLQIIDARGKEKSSYLIHLLERNSPLLIISFQYGELPWQISTDMLPVPLAKPLKYYCDKSGLQPFQPGMNTPQDIVIFDLPYHSKQLKDLLRGEDMRLHLLYNKNDQAILQNWLEAIVFNRTLLNSYFKILRKIRANQVSHCTWDGLLQTALKSQIPVQAIPAVTLAVLNIFADCRLCRYEKTPAGITIYWSDPQPQVALSQSRHFDFYQQLLPVAQQEMPKLLSWSKQDLELFLQGEV